MRYLLVLMRRRLTCVQAWTAVNPSACSHSRFLPPARPPALGPLPSTLFSLLQVVPSDVLWDELEEDVEILGRDNLPAILQKSCLTPTLYPTQRTQDSERTASSRAEQQMTRSVLDSGRRGQSKKTSLGGEDEERASAGGEEGGAD